MLQIKSIGVKLKRRRLGWIEVKKGTFSIEALGSYSQLLFKKNETSKPKVIARNPFRGIVKLNPPFEVKEGQMFKFQVVE